MVQDGFRNHSNDSTYSDTDTYYYPVYFLYNPIDERKEDIEVDFFG